MNHEFATHLLPSINYLANKYNVVAWGTCELTSDKLVAIKYRIIHDDGDGSSEWVTSKPQATMEELLKVEQENWLLSGENYMNILSTGLFPHITGEMLQEKRATFTVTSIKEVNETIDGRNISVAEFSIKERTKTFRLNGKQCLKLMRVYGSPETNEWIGRKIVIYGERGTWFLSRKEIDDGTVKWALRVDEGKTAAAEKRRIAKLPATSQEAKATTPQASTDEPAPAVVIGSGNSPFGDEPRNQ